MRTIYIEKRTKVKKAIHLIESHIKIKILFDKGKVVIRGNELNEFLVEKIIKAVDFGFDEDDALLLKKEKYVLQFLCIKDYTKRRNLHEVRRRIIGTDGKAKRTIEELTGCVMVISGNQIGLIVDLEHLESANQGIISLIQGSKHSNVFSYLERQNRHLREINVEDLGLRDLNND